MIARLGSLLLLLYALGFVFFAFTLGKPARATAQPTDAAVVLTGGKGRIEHAIDALRAGKAGRLLIAGADPSVTKADLARRVPGSSKLIKCCVDLGIGVGRYPLERGGSAALDRPSPFPLGPPDHQRLAHAPRPI